MIFDYLRNESIEILYFNLAQATPIVHKVHKMRAARSEIEKPGIGGRRGKAKCKTTPNTIQAPKPTSREKKIFIFNPLHEEGDQHAKGD
jgi:hypothetical protein